MSETYSKTEENAWWKGFTSGIGATLFIEFILFCVFIIGWSYGGSH